MVRPWYYALVAEAGMKQAGQNRGVTYVSLEDSVRRLAPRPWLMIHGEKDSYIKPSMAKSLYDRAREPKDFWLVEGARHNQAIEVAADEYRRRVVGFFDEFLGGPG
ncbi:MAG: alpha/beta hydrolase, partial [Gemmataceae bacterium]|nr:alpha/beta hydrolase [Gemmataceae bacterium]